MSIESTANIAGRAQAVLKFFKMAAVESFGKKIAIEQKKANFSALSDD